MNNKFKKTITLFLCFYLSSVPFLDAMSNDAYQAYVRGLLASRAGDLESAITEYERVIALDDGAALAYRELASLYWQIGNFQKALETAQILEKLSGDNLETQLFLGSFYLLAGQAAQANTAWKKALEIDPENETAILYLAAFYSDRNLPEAITYWKKFIAKRPDSSQAYYQLGVSQERLGKLADATESFKKAIVLEPGEAQAYLSLAQLYEKQEEFDNAVSEYTKYIALVPNNLTVLMYLGGLYFRLKRFSEAETVFTQALVVSPHDMSVYFWLGILAEQKKDWDEAIKYFELIRQKEESVAVLTRLSFYYSASKKIKQALAYLKKVVVKDPNNPNSYYLLGLAYFDLKKYALSEENFRKALEFDPDFEEVHFHLGILYDNWGKFEKAVPELTKVIELSPKNATALNYLGYSYADRGIQLNTAEDLITRALALDPENGAYIDSLGWTYFKKGDFSRAEELLLAASKKLEDPTIWEHVGDVSVALNKFGEAWDAYHNALKIEPKNKRIAAQLKKLERRVLPKTIQRKILKRAIGNLLQVSSVQSGFSVSGKTATLNFHSFGTFQYKRPGKWRVDILGNLFTPHVIIVQNKGIKIYPQALEKSSYAPQLDYLDRVKEYFNASLLEQFDTDQVAVTVKGKYLVYQQGDFKLVIERRTSTIKEYSEGTRMHLLFTKYTEYEGLFVPVEIELVLPQQDIAAKIRFKSYVLNESLGEKVFEVMEGPQRLRSEEQKEQ